MMNKKGQGLQLNTLILIILGVLVLVAIIIGFYLGWAQVSNWINPPSNVKDVVQKCTIACSGASKYDFCNSVQSIKIENVLSDVDVGVASNIQTMNLSALTNKFSATCYELATLTTSLGIGDCPSLSCGAPPSITYTSKELAGIACAKAKSETGYKTGQKFKFVGSTASTEINC